MFRFIRSDDGRISDVFIMKALMKAYVLKFGDFFVNDGTYNVDMFILISP